MKSNKSLYLIVAISLFVGFLHFLIGPNYDGPFKIFMSSYLIDIMLPMNIYLLAQLFLRKNIRDKSARIYGALLTFLIGLTVETLQYFNINVFGSTFDPWDILMYGLGVLLGLSIDLTIISKMEAESEK